MSAHGLEGRRHYVCTRSGRFLVSRARAARLLATLIPLVLPLVFLVDGRHAGRVGIHIRAAEPRVTLVAAPAARLDDAFPGSVGATRNKSLAALRTGSRLSQASCSSVTSLDLDTLAPGVSHDVEERLRLSFDNGLMVLRCSIHSLLAARRVSTLHVLSRAARLYSSSYHPSCSPPHLPGRVELDSLSQLTVHSATSSSLPRARREQQWSDTRHVDMGQ